MEEVTSPEALKSALAELIATFLFVFVGVGAVGTALATVGTGSLDTGALLIIAFGHGLGIMLGVAAVGHISGGHLNPAVTFGMWITGQINLVRGVMHVVAQAVGAIAAVAILVWIFQEAIDRNVITDLGLHTVNTDILPNEIAGLVLEVVLTFVLVFVVFGVAVDKRGPAGIAPLAIGLVIVAIHLVAVPLTGASVNPARSLGPAVIHGEFIDHWIYWVGPLVGGGLGALVYHWVFLRGSEDGAG